MKIVKTIYKGVAEPPYLKTTISDTNRDGHIRQKRVESYPSKINSKMGKHTGKYQQRYVDRPRDRPQLTFLIHGPIR